MDALKKLPKMDVLLASGSLTQASAEISYSAVRSAARACLDDLRRCIQSGAIAEPPAVCDIEEMIIERARSEASPRLKRVVNATGIILHTNLGRAPLGEELAGAAAGAATGYCNLEYELESGERGSRHAHVESLIRELTGAESAMVVNNNAAAVFLMLNTLAKDKNVAISRGELVEIGGAFRVPDIMAQSGARLVEVGTTNMTRRSDYESAVTDRETSVLLKVHTSNFKITGFTEDTSLVSLSELAGERGLLLLEDLGSCLPCRIPGLEVYGGTAADSIKAGADIVCFSGDKLLGASQAGIIIGKREYIDAMKKNPFTRMLRPCKLTLAVLECALRLLRSPEAAVEKLPVLRMLSQTPDELESRAESLAVRLRTASGWDGVEVRAADDALGGGTTPETPLPGYAVAITPPDRSVNALESELRHWSVPVVARIHKGRLLISPRTLTVEDEDYIAEQFAACRR